MTAKPRSFDSTIRGKRFGHLIAEYADVTGRRIACRCICSRKTFVAAAELIAGTIDSCGCRPAPAAYHKQQADLSAQLTREIGFGGGRPRNRDKSPGGSGHHE